MKNISCFERPFKILKNSGFGISFFGLEILMFLYYANWESDDIMRCATKMVKY